MAQKKITGYTIFLDEKLGSGSFGTVYKCEKNDTKEICAVKVLSKKESSPEDAVDADEYLHKTLIEEITILQALHSPNIVSVKDVMESGSNYYIVQEICDGGDLQHFIAKHANLAEAEAIRITRDICAGFLPLVKEGIVHRDLKPANILIAKGTPKLADFGFAKKKKHHQTLLQSAVGTPLYMSTQVLKNERYSSKCDVWALGLIFYELLHQKTPWTARSEYELVNNILREPLKFGVPVSEKTKEFIRGCLGIEEKDRFSWEEVFLHPIFENHFAEVKAQNEHFANKWKTIMREIRLMVKSKNLDLRHLLERLNFHDKNELTFEEFARFIRLVNPHITDEEMEYFFQKLDTDSSEKLEIAEIERAMSEHGIAFQRAPLEQQIPANVLAHGLSRQTNAQASAPQLAVSISASEHHATRNAEYFQQRADFQAKAKKCFVKLYRFLLAQNQTLYKTFMGFTHGSTQMTHADFSTFIRRLDGTTSEEELSSIFRLLDLDQSGAIDFDEFHSYYCKVNGIPETLELPPEYFKQFPIF